MLQAQQSSPSSSLFSPQTNSMPTPSLPSIHPPGTDPCNISSSPVQFIQNEFQFPPTFAFHQHSTADGDPNPIRWVSDVNSVNEKTMILNTLWNRSWMSQDLVTGQKTGQLIKDIHTIRCEFCKIDCNSQNVFEKHILGKRHKRNVQLQIVSTATIPKTAETFQNCLAQMISGDSGVAVWGKLELDKHKKLESGVSVNSQILCTVCNVPCNSQAVFNIHLTGRKHSAQVARQAAARLLSGAGSSVTGNFNPISLTSSIVQPCNNITPKQGHNKTLQSSWCDVCKISCNSYEILSKHKIGRKHLNRIARLNPISFTIPTVRPCDNGILKQGPNNILQSAWCEICKISCNSCTILSKHKLGKKHLKNLVKLNTTNTLLSTAATATELSIGSTENLEASNGKTLDLEKSKKKVQLDTPVEDPSVKRQKIMESGAAAGAVRMCTICNMDFNSSIVFDSHLAGKKHAAMVRKQAEAVVKISGPQIVADT